MFQGHQVQVFADISPYTVQKRRALKPLLQILAGKEITYRWAFPLRLNFSYHNKPYSFSTFQDGERLLLQLGLITQEVPVFCLSRSNVCQENIPHQPSVASVAETASQAIKRILSSMIRPAVSSDSVFGPPLGPC